MKFVRASKRSGRTATARPADMNVFGFTGYSGSGKTTLIERLIPLLRRRGLTISVLKHAHHGFDIDRPGKDSYRMREAGCGEVMLVSGRRWVLMHEFEDILEPSLDDMLSQLSPCDLVLVEGFKHSAIPKIEVHRPDTGRPPIWPSMPQIVAVATDAPDRLEDRGRLPLLDLNDAESIAAFVLDQVGLSGPPRRFGAVFRGCRHGAGWSSAAVGIPFPGAP